MIQSHTHRLEARGCFLIDVNQCTFLLYYEEEDIWTETNLKVSAQSESSNFQETFDNNIT